MRRYEHVVIAEGQHLTPCEQKIVDLHLECNEGENARFSAFMGPRASMYAARCVLGCIAWMRS